MKALWKSRMANTMAMEPNSLRVLLIGNNPIEMNSIYEGLLSLNTKIKQVYISFNENDFIEKFNQYHPDCVIIDDNIGVNKLKALVSTINRTGNRNSSITLLKSLNKEEIISGVNEYILKNGLTKERLFNSLKNSLRFSKTQAYLKNSLLKANQKVKKLVV